VRGIVLAGGSGTRLWPITRGVSKQLLPVFDKPLVYYPISTLMLSGIREILIITTPRDAAAFKELLGSGENLGVKFSYAVQEKPGGIAESIIIAKNHIENEVMVLILGDNIFYGNGIGELISRHKLTSDAHIFAYRVSDPERYGVIEFGKDNSVVGIEEKPTLPLSRFVVPGLYIYPKDALDLVRTLRPSARNELEITDLNNLYIKKNRLSVSKLPRGTAWLDTGTFESLNSASNFVRIIEERQGLKVACLEEIAWRKGWINKTQLLSLAKKYRDSSYLDYISSLFE